MTDSETEVVEIGRWVLQRVLGSGTFGKVMLFKHKDSDEMVAVKKCHSEIVNASPENWRREVEILHNLKHPGLVKALPIPEELQILSKDAPILCMEYCAGGDLRQLLNKPINCCGLPEREVLNIAKDVASAIQYLHSQQVVHRDLKPENVVIQLKDNKKVYKLIDLGYAKDLSHQSLCKTLVGTLQYLAPELFLSDKYSCTVDYWSFGLVIHECITGVRPFLPGLPPLQWMRQVEVKSREDICIYSRPDGTVVFSTTLFKENHLSSVMKILMEQWLRYMLDWNPLMRGKFYSEDEELGRDRPVVAFDQLNDILSTESVSIFWVDGLTHLSYIVGDEISMDTLHGWIERDTGIRRQHQLLLLPRGTCPDMDRSAHQLVVQNSADESTSVSTAAYLFSRANEGFESRIGQPELMDSMLSDPRAESPYPILKRMWAQSVYWINQQHVLYRKLLSALKVHSTYLTLKASSLKQQVVIITSALRHVTSAYELFMHSLRLDQRNYQMQSQRGGLPSCAMLEKWGKEETILTTLLNELQANCASLEQSFNDAMSSLHDAAKTVGAFLTKPSRIEGLETCVQEALDLYATLQKRPRDQRDQPENSIPMTKIVFRTLKMRKEAFTDVFTQIRLVEKCSAELEHFPQTLALLKNEIGQFQEQMLQRQTRRQNDVWTLLERAVTMWQQTSMMNDHFTPPTSSVYGTVPNFLSVPSLQLVDKSSAESLACIQENQVLRYQIQDTLSRSLSTTCISMQNGPDWSFLED